MRRTLMIFALMYSSAGYTVVGGGVSGGSLAFDNYSQAAWFQEKQSVKYCITLSPTFPISKKEISNTIQFAVQSWKKEMNRVSPEINEIVATEFVDQGECNGKEDINFLMGIVPKDLAVVESINYKYVSLASVQKMNSERSWKQGYVYVRESSKLDTSGGEPIVSLWVPDWTKENFLKAVLLHEIGHIFGMSHVPGTIMREDISNWLENSNVDDQKEIEHEYTLVPEKALSKEMPLVKKSRYSYSFGESVIDLIPEGKLERNEGSLLFNVLNLSRAEPVFRFEEFVRAGTITYENNVYPVMFSKNNGGFAYHLKYFKGGKWQTIIRKTAVELNRGQ